MYATLLKSIVVNYCFQIMLLVSEHFRSCYWFQIVLFFQIMLLLWTIGIRSCYWFQNISDRVIGSRSCYCCGLLVSGSGCCSVEVQSPVD